MSDYTPIDGEYGLDYQIFVLKKMIGELPDEIQKHLLAQTNEIIRVIAVRQKLLVALIIPKLEDLRVDIKAMEFDCEATTNERNDLTARLKEILGDNFQI